MTDQITEQTKEMIEMVQIFLKEIEEKGGVENLRGIDFERLLSGVQCFVRDLLISINPTSVDIDELEEIIFLRVTM